MSHMLTLKELASFHSVDIQAVARLVKKLAFDPDRAKQIVAFWSLLERLGNKDFIKNVLSWSIISFRQAANEAITSLNFLKREVYHEGDDYYGFLRHIRLMSLLISQELIFSPEERSNAMTRMERFEKNVLDRLLQATVPRDVADVRQIEPAMAAGEELIRDSWIKGGQGDNLTNQDLHDVLLRSRGLLITSDEGHRVTKEELFDFFARRYEDSVEAILVDLHSVPWFALVVFIFPSNPTAIVKGKSPVMLSINGKVVFARRYNPRSYVGRKTGSKGAEKSTLGKR